MSRIAFTVIGQPQPAGSKSIGRKKDGSVFIRHSGAEKQRPWRADVKDKANEAMGGRGLLDGPLLLRLVFVRPRPGGHFKTNGDLSAAGLRAPYPATRPDATKLARGLEDALIGVVFREDSQVVHLDVRKEWGEPARADVEVVEL